VKSNHLRFLIAALLISILTGLPRLALASGHGPVFGAATPTLGKGGWQLDQAWLGRLVEGAQTDEQTLRTMISFGITEDLQISGSVPIVLDDSLLMPRGRVTTMMSLAREAEVIGAWRFHRQASATGRFESTLSGGFSVPLQEYTPDGMQAAPGLHVSAATGYASRTHYAWIGGGYQHHLKKGQDQMGEVVYLTGVYGYRPPALRLDYPKPDLRFFVEAMAERTARGLHHGFEFLSSGGTAVFVGPTALLLYKAYGLEGGVMFPVYQNTNGALAERVRIGVNVSYFFWLR
jgi:hypothetical protein